MAVNTMLEESQGTVPALEKTLANLRAQFALAGHEMRVVRNRDGRVLYEVSRWGQTRVFSTVHDVAAFHVQIGGANSISSRGGASVTPPIWADHRSATD